MDLIEITTKEIAGLPVLELVSATKKAEALPLVIFYHGWTGCKEKVLMEGYELAKRGLRVVLPDAKFHGQRQVGETITHRQEFWEIVASSVKEFPTLVAYYQKNVGIKENKLGVSGLSMGAITTCALLTVYEQITAGVSLMGSPCPVEFAHRLIAELPGIAELPAEYIAEQLQQLEVIDLSRQPEKIAGRPVHFWHGTADEVVLYGPDHAFYEQIKGKPFARNVTFTTAEGQGHKVSYQAAVEMAEKFAEYFNV